MTRNERKQQAAARRAEILAKVEAGTARAVAKELGISEQRVSQLVQKARAERGGPRMVSFS